MLTKNGGVKLTLSAATVTLIFVAGCSRPLPPASTTEVSPPTDLRTPTPLQEKERPAAASDVTGLSPESLTKSFPEVKAKEELFRVTMVKTGRFRFCLMGTKPAKDRFVFQALVVRRGAVHRIDYVTAVPPGQTEINTCATMLTDEEQVREGEVVTVESILKTAGPLHLTLKIVELRR